MIYSKSLASEANLPKNPKIRNTWNKDVNYARISVIFIYSTFYSLSFNLTEYYPEYRRFGSWKFANLDYENSFLLSKISYSISWIYSIFLLFESKMPSSYYNSIFGIL